MSDSQVETAQWASFYLAGELFALQVEHVQEVLLQQSYSPVPLAPAYIIGLVNLRGQIIAAIDLRTLLHFPTRQESGTLLVVKDRELIGIVVDEIGDVLELPASGWRPPPDTLAEKHRGFVFGIWPMAERLVLGLRIELLGGAEGEKQEIGHG